MPGRARNEQNEKSVSTFLPVPETPFAEQIRGEVFLAPVADVGHRADRDLRDAGVIEARRGRTDLLYRTLVEDPRPVDHVPGKRR